MLGHWIFSGLVGKLALFWVNYEGFGFSVKIELCFVMFLYL